jgi:hypothetical protein
MLKNGGVKEKMNCRGLGGGTTGRVPQRGEVVAWRLVCLARPHTAFSFPAIVNFAESRTYDIRLSRHLQSFVFPPPFQLALLLRSSSESSALARIISVMAESLALHEAPGGALTAEKTVHMSIPQRQRPSRPHYLDWILHHQIGRSPPAGLMILHTQTDFLQRWLPL